MFQQLLAPDQPTLPYDVLLWLNLADGCGVVASGFVVDRIGRRGCFALGFFGQAVLLSLLVGCQHLLLAYGAWLL